MAKEYIEHEALLDIINSAPVSMSICMNVDECKGRIYERERLVRVINAIPAADVVPVRHGHFIANTNPFVAPCSECGHTLNRRWHYCPNCGAKMDGDGE